MVFINRFVGGHMTFYLGNRRIWITNSSQDVVFDTNIFNFHVIERLTGFQDFKEIYNTGETVYDEDRYIHSDPHPMVNWISGACRLEQARAHDASLAGRVQVNGTILLQAQFQTKTYESMRTATFELNQSGPGLFIKMQAVIDRTAVTNQNSLHACRLHYDLFLGRWRDDQ